MGLAFDFEKTGNVVFEASNPNKGDGQSIVELQSALHKGPVSVVACAPAEPPFVRASKQQTERVRAPEEVTAVVCAPEELTEVVRVPEEPIQVACAPEGPTEVACAPEELT